mgnify:CR=1 FL=1|tara:strand:- start:120 stop:557 length:438 start_codon:yes stop_codon:yes gene_type:complete
MGGEWDFEIIKEVKIDIISYYKLLINLYEKYNTTEEIEIRKKNNINEIWNKKQYNTLKHILENEVYLETLKSNLFINNKPFLTMECLNYKFELNINPNEIITCLHARGITDYYLAKKIYSIQKRLVFLYNNKFSIWLPDGLSGYN